MLILLCCMCGTECNKVVLCSSDFYIYSIPKFRRLSNDNTNVDLVPAYTSFPSHFTALSLATTNAAGGTQQGTAGRGWAGHGRDCLLGYK